MYKDVTNQLGSSRSQGHYRSVYQRSRPQLAGNILYFMPFTSINEIC